MQTNDIKPNVILRGPIFPEPVKVITTNPMGDSLKIVGEGMQSGSVRQTILNEDQIAQLQVLTKS